MRNWLMVAIARKPLEGEEVSQLFYVAKTPKKREKNAASCGLKKKTYSPMMDTAKATLLRMQMS